MVCREFVLIACITKSVKCITCYLYGFNGTLQSQMQSDDINIEDGRSKLFFRESVESMQDFNLFLLKKMFMMSYKCNVKIMTLIIITHLILIMVLD